MHHMKVYKSEKQRARSERFGYHKNPPPTAEDQARETEAFNLIVQKLIAQGNPIVKNIQFALI